MALKIETFSNAKGGNAFFKAIGHPLAARKATALLDDLSDGPVAVYDPLGYADALHQIHDLSRLDIAGYCVQDLDDLGNSLLGRPAQPVTDLAASGARRVLVTAFDAGRLVDHVRHLLPAGAEVVTLDELRLPDDMLADRRNYMNRLNFATNFVLFWDADGRHTRLVTANYWSAYGAEAPELWLCLLDGDGRSLAEWREPLPPANALVAIDSRAVRARFGLGPFAGQLFVHVLRPAGHDIVKYALDTYGDRDEELSCTHDANPWPAERYAGLPAPRADERVVLWIQNSHPTPIPAGAVGLNVMGREEVAWLDRSIPPFGCHALDTAELLPDARWPQQLEVRAGKHFVRPRYEVVRGGGRRLIAHANVERVDLAPDPQIPELGNLLGKGYILPAPLLPPSRYRSIVLPTPMSTAQNDLPIRATVYDAEGQELASRRLGRLPRDHATALDLEQLLDDGQARPNGALANGAWGHVELTYDFAEGGEADGWLHGIFRYEDKLSGHAAETSFGAHMFNSVLTYRGEPQSYAGRAPGLSTRLFLRLGPAPYATLCHLIYPASTPWHERSATRLILNDATGQEIAAREVAIPCGGSLLWRADELFDAGELGEAGDDGYVIVRDTTCRLFGYHGLLNGEQSFSLDHMFGF